MINGARSKICSVRRPYKYFYTDTGGAVNLEQGCGMGDLCTNGCGSGDLDLAYNMMQECAMDIGHALVAWKVVNIDYGVLACAGVVHKVDAEQRDGQIGLQLAHNLSGHLVCRGRRQ